MWRRGADAFDPMEEERCVSYHGLKMKKSMNSLYQKHRVCLDNLKNTNYR